MKKLKTSLYRVRSVSETKDPDFRKMLARFLVLPVMANLTDANPVEFDNNQKSFGELVIFASLKKVQQAIQQTEVKIAAVNGAENIAIVGEKTQLQLIETKMKEANVFVQRVPQPRIHSLLQFLPSIFPSNKVTN